MNKNTCSQISRQEIPLFPFFFNRTVRRKCKLGKLSGFDVRDAIFKKDLYKGEVESILDFASRGYLCLFGILLEQDARLLNSGFFTIQKMVDLTGYSERTVHYALVWLRMMRLVIVFEKYRCPSRYVINPVWNSREKRTVFYGYFINRFYKNGELPKCRSDLFIKINAPLIFNIKESNNRLSVFDYYGITKGNKTDSEEIDGNRLESIQSNFFKKARFDSINADIAVENSRRAAEPVKGGERQQPGQAAIEFYGSSFLDKYLIKGSRLANSPKNAYFFSTPREEEQGKEMNFDKEKEAKEQILSQLLHEGLLLLDENRKREALTYPVDDIRRSANALRRCKGPLTNAPGYFMKVLTSDNFQGGLRPATSREAPSETMFGTERRSMRATPKSDRGDESTDLDTVFEKVDRQRAAMGLQPEPKWEYKTDFTGMSDDEVKEAKQEADRIHLERNHAAYFTRKIERARKFRKEGAASPDLEVLENEIASFREKQAAGLIKRHAEETNEEKLDKWGKYLESEAGKIAQKMLGQLQPPPLHLPEDNERIVRDREKRERYMQTSWGSDIYDKE